MAVCTEGRHPFLLPLPSLTPLLLYWPAHIGGRRRRIWRGRLVKVTLLIQTHRNASRWPALFLLSQRVAPPFASASFLYWDFFFFFFLMVVHGQSPAAFRPAGWPGGASGLRCQAPASLHPNTSSALSCKYHQQLVARNLVVLNKSPAYMGREWGEGRGSGGALPCTSCQSSGARIELYGLKGPALCFVTSPGFYKHCFFIDCL